jgi:hypothetical protein
MEVSKGDTLLLIETLLAIQLLAFLVSASCGLFMSMTSGL